MDYFELFDIPVQLKIAKGSLRQKYLSLSRQYHPDHQAQQTAHTEEEVLEASARLNQAYKTLGDEDALIAYVLEQKGVLEREEKYVLPSTFLMEMMDLNEALTEASEDSKETIQNQLKELQNEIYAPVKNIMESYLEGVTSEKELLQVKEYYFKKKYLYRLAHQLDQKL
ncbi:MAG: chaperone protein HscB [Flaviaesturariibacter sp.]|nr:chaperone protein HscB [Flaviaesturariibacter sp.]